ncbi:LacI family DNA-binding transcriptional regulator [Jannaschia sp. CCS1]|uniref:LacI family DNA-binding transcriptional regulator n=1 Tax=Jannaschia sp. (strain CCS1) TaxID=290400 RepID=UPI000053ADDB|nr:LacI family DNA-binding transcriptional regulator [Jannaschia sp. CCS1]ABD56008.1 transcriptional regulator, LacI family [Jannaschia sp. CCS1]
MPTVKDVARHAGVSVGTVSKVLSRDDTVKEALRDRVLSAVTDLGYKPNMAARALRTKKVNIIGLVVPDITNPFFANLAKDIEMLASARGHTVMLTNSHDDAPTEKRQIEALLDQNPSGLIVVASSDASGIMLDGQVPVISIDRRLGAFPLVATDHADGSAKIAEHLVHLGHRRIAYLAGPQNTEVGRLRLAGFERAIATLEAHHEGLRVTKLSGNFDYQTGETLARDLLIRPVEDRPTAIAAASDQMAIGVLRAANDMGLSVPGDVSLAGFDNVALAELVVPRLTTIAQPTRALAEAAIGQLLDRPSADMTDEVISGTLVARGSTAAV